MKKYLKLIPGKGLSKNKPTCENAISQTLYGSCKLRVLLSTIEDPSRRQRYPFCRRSINSTTDIYCLLTVYTVRWQKIIRADAVMFVEAVFYADSIILTRIGETYIYRCVKERKKQLLKRDCRREEKRVEKEMEETKRKREMLSQQGPSSVKWRLQKLILGNHLANAAECQFRATDY